MSSIANPGRVTGARRFAALALGAGLLGTAIFSHAAPSAAADTAASVKMHDIAFVPQLLTVTPGTKITWTNDDEMVHTVTSGVDHDDGVWTSSPSVVPGGTFSLTLTKPGTYHYYCKPHMYSAAMHATIVVKPKEQ